MKIITTFLFFTYISLYSQAQYTEYCYQDSNTFEIHLDSTSALQNYGGVLYPFYNSNVDFSNYTFENFQNRNFHFSTPLHSANKLTFVRNYVNDGSNGLPFANFINISIGNNTRVVSTTDSLQSKLSIQGYNVQVYTSPDNNNRVKDSIIISGANFNSFSIGIGIEATLRDICVLATTTNTNIKESIKESITVYPNPSSGIINISSLDFISYKIFDLRGKIISQANKVNGINQINLQSYQKGIYLIKIETPNGTQTKRIVLQ